MNFQRYKTLWIAGIILGVLAVAAGGLALRSRGAYKDARSKFKNAETSLERLQRAQPFPSAENLAMARANVEQLEAFRGSLLHAMSRNQFQPLDVEPAAFPLGPALFRLRGAARQAGVEVKDQSFGFERYVQDGVPPGATNEVGRLTVQLQVIEHLCRVLFQSGIAELVAVRRHVFEGGGVGDDSGGPPARGARRGALRAETPVQAVLQDIEEEENALYRAERVELTFVCDPPALWRVLNAVAADKTFVVVRDLKIETEKIAQTSASVAAAPARPPATPGSLAAGSPPPPPPSREERIVAGREKVNVTLTVDVYRFLMPVASAESGPRQGDVP